MKKTAKVTFPDIPRQFRECQTCALIDIFDQYCLKCTPEYRNGWIPKRPRGTIRVIDEKPE